MYSYIATHTFYIARAVDYVIPMCEYIVLLSNTNLNKAVSFCYSEPNSCCYDNFSRLLSEYHEWPVCIKWCVGRPYGRVGMWENNSKRFWVGVVTRPKEYQPALVAMPNLYYLNNALH